MSKGKTQDLAGAPSSLPDRGSSPPLTRRSPCLQPNRPPEGCGYLSLPLTPSVQEEEHLRLSPLALNSTLTSLQTTPTWSPDKPPTPLPTLASDFQSLLHLLKSHTTSLSLALGKRPITPHAALPYLKKLSVDFGRLQFLVHAVVAAERVEGNGGELVSLQREWSWARDDVRDGLVGLLEGFQRDVTPTAEGETPGGEKEYLHRVGVVYEAVDRGLKGLSWTGLDAVRKRWRTDGEALADGEEEAREMLKEEEDEEEEEENEEDGDEDGWQGLMGGKSAKLTKEEKDRIQKVSSRSSLSLSPSSANHAQGDLYLLPPRTKLVPLLRLPYLLHAHLLKHHLTPAVPLSHLSSLLPLSTTLLLNQDELVSNLDSSDEMPIDELALRVSGAARKLKAEVARWMDEDSKKGENEEEEDGRAKRRKWLDVWETQMIKAEEAIPASASV